MSSQKKEKSALGRRLYRLELALRYQLGLKQMADCPTIAIDHLRIAYFAVPKAANSSIRAALWPTLTGKTKKPEDIQRETSKYTEKAGDVISRMDSRWYAFTVVREPGSRLLSAWRNKLAEAPEIFEPIRTMGIDERISFADFLAKCDKMPVKMLNDHFLPQHHLLRNVLKLDGIQVFKTETLDQDWPTIQREFLDRGAANIPELAFLNKSSDSSTNELQDPRVKQILSSLYASDYTEFGYDLP